MRVADRRRTIGERPVADGDGFVQHLAFGTGDGNLAGGEADLPHLDADLLPAREHGGAHHPALGFDGEFFVFIDHLLVEQETGEDAQAVAALFCFAAVRVEDFQGVFGLLRGQGTEEDAIRADAEMPVADRADAIGGQGLFAVLGFDDEVIVSEGVILVELHAGAGRYRSAPGIQ